MMVHPLYHVSFRRSECQRVGVKAQHLKKCPLQHAPRLIRATMEFSEGPESSKYACCPHVSSFKLWNWCFIIMISSIALIPQHRDRRLWMSYRMAGISRPSFELHAVRDVLRRRRPAGGARLPMDKLEALESHCSNEAGLYRGFYLLLCILSWNNKDADQHSR